MAGAGGQPKAPRQLRYASRRTRTVVHRTGTAADVMGPFEDGACVSGLTAGQFSAIDALEHLVNEVGPADVAISTWTTGIYDVDRADQLRRNGYLRGIRMLLDRGTFEKSPKFAGPLIRALGADSFRCLSVHAKVVVVTGDRGAAVFRSSMNLNKNLRTEQFDLSWGGPLPAFYLAWFDALWDESGAIYENQAIIEAVYDRFEAEAAGNALRADAAGAAAGRDVSDPGDLSDLRLGDDL